MVKINFSRTLAANKKFATIYRALLGKNSNLLILGNNSKFCKVGLALFPSISSQIHDNLENRSLAATRGGRTDLETLKKSNSQRIVTT